MADTGAPLNLVKHARGEDYSIPPTHQFSSDLLKIESNIQTQEDTIATQTSALAGLVSGQQNLVINGGFRIWQRGTLFNTASSCWTADGWCKNTDGVVERSTTHSVTDSSALSQYSLSLKTSIVGQTSTVLGYIPGSYLQGSSLTLAATVISASSNKARIHIHMFSSAGESLGEAFSPYHTGGGTAQRLVVNKTFSTSATSSPSWIEIELRHENPTSTLTEVLFYDVMAAKGAMSSLAYLPSPHSFDYAQALRHYQTWDPLWLPGPANEGEEIRMSFIPGISIGSSGSPATTFTGASITGTTTGTPYIATVVGSSVDTTPPTSLIDYEIQHEDSVLDQDTNWRFDGVEAESLDPKDVF